MRKYYQSTSKALAQVLQSLIMLKDLCWMLQDELRQAAASLGQGPEAGGSSIAAEGTLDATQAYPEALPETQSHSREPDSVVHEPQGADPTQGMSDKQKRMWNLQQKLQQSRKANQGAVIAEKKRDQVCIS